MGVITQAKDLLKTGEIKVISKTKTQIMVKVNDYIITLKKRSGYVLDSCSCQNHARFNKINPRCSHKLAASTYLVMRGLE